MHRLAAGANPLTLAVPETHIEEAPVNSFAADVAAPSVVNVVFELALIDEVVALSSEALQATIFVDLTELAMEITLPALDLTHFEIGLHGVRLTCGFILSDKQDTIFQ